MSIPITCPGCQAAFEVPESLAGKTIRCTSCKTQLTIPAAAMASADAKKPFGWASKPAETPLSLDDEAPVATVCASREGSTAGQAGPGVQRQSGRRQDRQANEGRGRG